MRLSEEERRVIACVSKYPLSEIENVIKETEAHVLSKLTKDLPDVREEVARMFEKCFQVDDSKPSKLCYDKANEVNTLYAPALLAAAQKAREEVIKELNKPCPHNPSGINHSYLKGTKRDCIFCWKSLGGMEG